MGAGKWRGGGGIDWQALNEGTDGRMATGSSDGDEILGKGVLGGHPSPQSRTFLKRGDQLIRVKPHRMAPFQQGDILIKLSAGGAGVGDPLERDIDAVVEDVRNEFVSVEAAQRMYGVCLDADTLEVDREQTEKLRSAASREEAEVLVDEEQLEVYISPR